MKLTLPVFYDDELESVEFLVIVIIFKPYCLFLELLYMEVVSLVRLPKSVLMVGTGNSQLPRTKW